MENMKFNIKMMVKYKGNRGMGNSKPEPKQEKPHDQKKSSKEWMSIFPQDGFESHTPKSEMTTILARGETQKSKRLGNLGRLLELKLPIKN